MSLFYPRQRLHVTKLQNTGRTFFKKAETKPFSDAHHCKCYAMSHKTSACLAARLRSAAKRNTVTGCSIRQRWRLPTAAPLHPLGELLMAAGQPRLSLFSGPIRSISAKHNQEEPQGTDLIPPRRCHLLHALVIDRSRRKRISGGGAEHCVPSQADHVIESSKTRGRDTRKG